MKTSLSKIDPAQFILSALSPKERLDAAMRIARKAFQNATLTIEDIEAAVREGRRKHYGARQKKVPRCR